MPELPEAESISRALKRALTGRTIVKVETFAPKLRTSLEPLKEAGLEGRKFTDVRRRARYSVCDLDDGRAVVMHYGMSGVVRVEAAGERRKHEHVWIWLDDGRAVKFEDPRRFGSVEVQGIGADGWPEGLAGIGVEPLTRAFTGEHLYGLARKRKAPVKVFIMDNAVVTGIGNIYATETLWRCGVSPSRRADEVTAEEYGAIAKTAKEILRAAIRMGGTSVSDFLNVDGSEGRFGQKLAVYGKAGGECPKCGGKIAAVVLGGRTSAYCPVCQK